MCGICGFNWNEKDLIKKMNDVIKHRGPDQSESYLDDNISLGHMRLSIIDLSEKGKQPMGNEDGSIQIVFNGEIYNYLEIKKTLLKKNHRFISNTDTEVIIHLYEEYGEKCVNYLRGMFAFAIWDSNNKKLFLARDRLGIKPLFYTNYKEKFLFASEIKSILQYKELPRKLNENALNLFLSLMYVPKEETMFKGIYELLPGHTLIFQNNKIGIRKYWNLQMNPSNKSEEFYLNSFKKLLKESIEMRLMSDVPLGAFLSGGIDSSSIVGLMSIISKEPVKTFSVGFEEDDDELNDAKIIAEHFNTDHRELIVKPDSLDVIPQLIWHLDEPMADPVNLPTFLMSKLAKKHVTVVLSGEGGDELFGGYQRYSRIILNEKLIKSIPKVIRKNVFPSILNITSRIDKFNRNKIVRRLEFISTLDDKEKNFAMFSSVFNEKEKNELLTNKILSKQFKSVEELMKPYFNNGMSYLNQALLYDVENFLPNEILTKTDRMTMAHSLEARVPFLDHFIAEFSGIVPTSLKIKNGVEKYIIRKSLSELLPNHTIKKKKQGFAVPLHSWFGKELRDVTFNFLSESNIHKEYFKYKYIKNILNKKEITKRGPRFNQIWSLLCFEIWYRMYIDNDYSNKPNISLRDL